MSSSERLTDSIWMIDTGSPYDSWVYLVAGHTRAALIDCGTGLATNGLLAEIDRAGFGDRLTDVFITHYHADHAGGASHLQRLRNFRLHASAETADALATGDEEATQVQRGREAGLYPSDYRYGRCRVDAVVQHGAWYEIGNMTITAYGSPGHCAGHLCFLAEDGGRTMLFSGDALFYGGYVSIQPIPDCNPYLYARTAEDLAQLRVDMLLPGHGDVALTGASQHLVEAANAFRKLRTPPNTRTLSTSVGGVLDSSERGKHRQE